MPADRKFLAIAAFALAACCGLAGCEQTLARRDFVSAQTGDTIAGNMAIHIVDPWPRESFDTRIPADGGRSTSIVGRYRAGETTASRVSVDSGAKQTSVGP